MKKEQSLEKIREQDEMQIDLIELLYALKKRILFLLAAALLGGLLAGVYTKLFVTPLYTSTSTLLVLSKDTTLTSITDLQLGTQLANDYSVLTVSRPVLEGVIEDLGLNMSYGGLKGSVAVTNPSSTRLLEITVTNPDPEQAKKIADAIAETASAYVGEQMEVIPPKIIEKGVVSAVPVNINMSRNILMGILAGIVIVAGVVIILTIIDDTVKTEADVERYLGVPTLGVIPDRRDYITNQTDDKKKKKRRRRRKKKWQSKK